MAQFNELSVSGLQTARLRELGEALSRKRTKEESDVVLVCHYKEFFAHKLVLETASPYFETMFSKEWKETKTGKIVFDQMDPETLEIVLNFIYLGEVSSNFGRDVFEKVIEASHLMELEKLFKYCCYCLGELLTVDYFLQPFMIGEQFESEILRTKVEKFWVMNASKICLAGAFLSASENDLRALVVFLKCRKFSLDCIINGIMQWLLHDLENRLPLAEDLIKCFDGEILSKECVTKLLQYTSIMDSSEVIAREVKELSLTAFTSEKDIWLENRVGLLGCNDFPSSVIFVFTSDVDTLCRNPTPESLTYIQELDLYSRTWHTPLNANLLFNHVLYNLGQYDKYIFFFKLNGDIRYDLQSNSFKSFGTSVLPQLCRLYYFKDYFYAFQHRHKTNVVYCRRLRSEKWRKANSFQEELTVSLVLTSHSYIYVIGINLDVHYSLSPAHGSNWICQRHKKNKDGDHYNYHYFVLDDTLNKLEFGYSQCRHMTFNLEKEKFEVVRSFHWPNTEPTVLELCSFQDPNGIYVFFSNPTEIYLPTYYWEPHTGNWKKLPPPQGKRAFEGYSNMAYSLRMEDMDK